MSFALLRPDAHLVLILTHTQEQKEEEDTERRLSSSE